ncbi:MAG: hypothetical protein ACP5LB_02610 [Candidatus Bathyarchaeia archaeon]
MTKLTPLFTSFKTLNITYQTPRETLLGTPLTLPTTEPTDPQVAYAVQESDLPTFDVKPFSKVWLARVLAGGQFVTAGTLYWRMLKNGQSVASSSTSVSANYYWSCTACFLDVQVGDVLALKLWSSVSDSILDRYAFAVHVSRIKLFKTPLHKDVTIVCGGSSTFVNFSAGLTGTQGATYVYNGHTSINYNNNTSTGFTLSGITFLAAVEPYGLIRVAHGDATLLNTAYVNTKSTSPPSVYRFPVPTQIKCRGVLFG